MVADAVQGLFPPSTPAAAPTPAETNADAKPATPPEPPAEPTPQPSAAPAPDVPSAPEVPPTPAPTPAIQPATPQPAPLQQPDETEDDDDNVTIAHKKIINPISAPVVPGPNLSELLAKEEALTSLENQAQTGVEPPVVTPGSHPAEDNRVTPPHPPGHVISPTNTTGTPVDPNSISL